ALRNGLATFVYNAMDMSALRFQVVKESSPHGHLDLWGSAQASYTPDSPPGLPALIETYGSEIAERVDIRRWSELEAFYGKELLDQFDGNRIRRHISRSGLIIDGKVFASDCRTRYGPYPYCRYMRHAVFSASKSLAGWLTTLRMAEKYGAQIMHYKVSDYVDIKTEYAHWDEMTFDNLLSMVSGIGEVEPRRVSQYVETSGTANAGVFYNAATWEEKLAAVERIGFYPWAPGEVFRYASYDPFMLALALSELLRREEGEDADLWEMMNREVFQPIGIASLPIRQTLPDVQDRGVPIFNNGLFVTLEDVVKIEALIRAGGKFGNRQILHAELLKQPFDSGVEQNSYPTGWINNTGEESRYFRSFWYGLHQSTAGCEVRVPLMSGAGGNAILIMPNGTTALRFASGRGEDDDNDTWDQTPMSRVADAIRPLCGSNG
ncbi:MAG: hypothetical protein GY802_06140, partial [Gammaproteobacteria bacterium]|nr:hypothetical protein [Gammaproteobacteria bacterium]